MTDVQGRWVLVYGVKHHLQIYFSYIIVVCFIGGWNLIFSPLNYTLQANLVS
jgi:NADH:ubiquinone oxidoreductase subunit H